MPKSILTFACIAALTAGVLAQSPTPTPAAKPDAAKSKTMLALQGAWVFQTADGQDLTGQPEIRVTITDDKYVQTIGGEVVEKGSLKVDDTKKPIQLDLQVIEGNDAGASQFGVIELTTTPTGSTLVGKLTNPGTTTRPTDFAPAAGYFAFTASKTK
jgi:uncharacterized protein (TIGR03067 family)